MLDRFIKMSREGVFTFIHLFIHSHIYSFTQILSEFMLCAGHCVAKGDKHAGINNVIIDLSK